MLAARAPGSVRRAALVVALAAAFFAGTGLLAVVGGAGPLAAWRQLADGSLGSPAALGETLLRFAPMAMVAAGLAPGLRAGLFNVGSPGQMGVGALAAAMIAIHLPSPGGLTIVVALAAAAAGGALWSALAAELYVRWGANEIISTLALNFVAASLLGYLLGEPLQPVGANIAQSDPIDVHSHLPVIIGGTRANAGIVLTLAAAAALAVFNRTPAGYRLRMFGENRRLARQAAIDGRGIVRATMAVAGAAAGLAGAMIVLGTDKRLYATVADPVGYSGFFLALLAGMNAAAIVALGFLLAALVRGAESLQIGVGLAPEIIDAMIGLALLGFVVRRRLLERRGVT